MFSWVKKLLIIYFILFALVATVFFFYRESIVNFNKKAHSCSIQSENDDLSLDIHTRGGDSDSWTKEVIDFNGKNSIFSAVIFDVDVKNKSSCEIPEWNVRFDVRDDCFLNNGWCGDFEIHQFDENGQENVQRLDLRNYNPTDITLKHKIISSDLLIPLKKGDYFIYFPSMSASEFPIPRSNPSVQDIKSVTFGLILYFPGDPSLFFSDKSFAFYRMEKNLYDGFLFYVIIVVIVLVFVVSAFYAILKICRYKDAINIEKENRKFSYDSLTGVYNRNRFITQAEKVLSENPDEKYIILCSNIKGFKFYNYGFGENEGNSFLQFFASLLREKCSHYSCFVYGRLWRDEFVMLMKDSEFSEKILLDDLKLLKKRFENESFRVQLQYGAYRINDNSESVSVMCDKALMAEASSSEDLNVLVSYYDEQMLQQSMNERWAITHFDSGLHALQFVVFLQPQVTPDGKVNGAEALVRWNHHEKGQVPPGEFIPTLEQAGIVHHLDRFVWERSVQILSDWKKKGRDDLYISVNVSGRDFEMFDLYDVFTNLVEKYDVSPEKLKIEVTETVMLEKGLRYTSILKALRFYGFSIEIDDFGSGYSSLNTLKDIEADVIKIDMRFLQGNTHRERGNLIIESVINMVHRLNMSVVAEGVETFDQVQMLTKMGCDVFQGYYFAKPMSVQEFEDKYLK